MRPASSGPAPFLRPKSTRASWVLVATALAGLCVLSALAPAAVGQAAVAPTGVSKLLTRGAVTTYGTNVSVPVDSCFYAYGAVSGGRVINSTSYTQDFTVIDPPLSGPTSLPVIALGHSDAATGSFSPSSGTLYPLIGGASASSLPTGSSAYSALNSSALTGRFYLSAKTDLLLVAALSNDYAPHIGRPFQVVTSGSDAPVDSLLIARAALGPGWHSFSVGSSVWQANSAIGAILYRFTPGARCPYAWTNASAGPAPPARDVGEMVYDAADGYTVLFGGIHNGLGYSPTSILNDTWTYANGTWTNRSPVHSPPPAAGEGLMTYDAKDRYVLLVLGNAGPATYTWTYVHGTWSNISKRVAPPVSSESSVAYDEKDGYVVWYGGFPNADTWTFAHGTWTNLTSTAGTPPPARTNLAMTYDARDGYVLLFGGYTYLSGITTLNDTWAFSGGAWTQLSPTSAPSIRGGAAMVYDAYRDGVLLFGGCTGQASGGNCSGGGAAPGGSPDGDTWLFTGGQWTDLSGNLTTQGNVTVAPPSLADASLAYDPATDAAVLFGGYDGKQWTNTTWTFL